MAKMMVSIEKTVQEFRYEPFRCSFAVEKDGASVADLRAMYDKLQGLLDSIIDERLARAKQARGEEGGPGH